MNNDKVPIGKPQQQGKPERRCFECDSRLHLLKHCPHRNSGNKFNKHFPTQQFTNSSQQNTARVHSAVTVTSATSPFETQTNSSASPEAVAMHVNIAPSPTVELNTHPVNTLCDDIHLSSKPDIPIMHNAKYDIADLAYIDVHIDGLESPVKALHDSGAMISVIHPRVIQNIPHVPCEGNIKIRGLFGEPVNANMVTLFIKLPTSLADSIPVVMAMSPEVNSDLILTDPVVKALLSTERNDTELSTPPELFVQNDEDSTDTEDESNASSPVHHDSSGALSNAQLHQEQKQDATLTSSWALATKDKGGYISSMICCITLAQSLVNHVNNYVYLLVVIYKS